jgi:tRNA pseudouridine55 synthase
MDGVICVDKPSGMTSFEVVALLRKLTHERKAGHAGTLDPMATGVLPVFFGEATKAIPILPNSDKRYNAGMRLGITTDTGDITGKVISTAAVNVTDEQVREAVNSFKGEINQIPPMYSALKKDGKHLYEIARQGGSIERSPRKITIYDISIIGKDKLSGDYNISVHCSKGTYIRTLCEDIGKKLGSGAAMSSLRRSFAAGFKIEESHTLDEIKSLAEQDKLNDIILKVENVLSALPRISVTAKQAVRFRNGGELSFDRIAGVCEEGLYRIFCGNLFIGVGQADPQKRQIKVKCHFNRNADIGGEDSKNDSL